MRSSRSPLLVHGIAVVSSGVLGVASGIVVFASNHYVRDGRAGDPLQRPGWQLLGLYALGGAAGWAHAMLVAGVLAHPRRRRRLVAGTALGVLLGAAFATAAGVAIAAAQGFQDTPRLRLAVYVTVVTVYAAVALAVIAFIDRRARSAASVSRRVRPHRPSRSTPAATAAGTSGTPMPRA
ncbi:MAG TPA: hypothetical protein VNA12_06520 [Mycobacteriales bacterium]|nr:hypothetical protein [Mycobacteriales bacterium]